MENNQAKSINYYAAVGSGIALSLIIIGVLVGLSFLASVVFKDYSYGSTETALYALVFFSLILFFALPTLVIGRHGWRTVVASYIIQAGLLVVVAFVATAVFADKQRTYYDDTPSLCGSATLSCN